MLRINPFKNKKTNSLSHWQLQEITGDDDSDLYLAEREEELKNAQQTKRLQQMTVPGIIGPHEQPESMQDELDLS